MTQYTAKTIETSLGDKVQFYLVGVTRDADNDTAILLYEAIMPNGTLRLWQTYMPPSQEAVSALEAAASATKGVLGLEGATVTLEYEHPRGRTYSITVDTSGSYKAVPPVFNDCPSLDAALSMLAKLALKP